MPVRVGEGADPGDCTLLVVTDARPLYDTLAFLRTAWAAGDRFSHHGKRWHFDDIVVEPRPVHAASAPPIRPAVRPSSRRRETRARL